MVFEVKAVTIGLLICHDFRYDELYREYLRRRVQLVLHSYHNGHGTEKVQGAGDTDFAPAWSNRNSYGGIVISTMQAYAANNGMWISANNQSAPISAWPSFVVTPDGVVAAQLENEVQGVLLTEVDTGLNFHDGGQRWWRDRVATHGVLHSGRAVVDPRSDARTELFETRGEVGTAVGASAAVVAEILSNSDDK